MRRFANPVTRFAWPALVRRHKLIQVGDWITLA
jgi:hypothetical protein